ncbi:hypothetical protein B0O99DRAFT_290679 [Bisporella sp. PMI_857]|nr:hypothetical protein B0O99DRAFT_290679 [Bisporella sp. PMI_857]
MSSSLPLQIAETAQTASINHAPSPAHDVNPSSTTSINEPVKVSHPSISVSDPSLDKYAYEDSDSIDDEDDIPESVVKPLPRQANFGPLPDLRFEQSYLASISNAQSTGQVIYITIKDQVFFPLLQGLFLTLAINGWRHWNRSAALQGNSVGAKIRRWWWKTNNWHIGERVRGFGKDRKFAAQMGGAGLRGPVPGFTDVN